MASESVVKFGIMKIESFVNSRVEVSNLMVSKITTLESNEVIIQELTPDSKVKVRVKFCCNSGIKVERESVFLLTLGPLFCLGI